MPKIGHIVLSEGIFKSAKDDKTILLEPFSNLDVPEFPHEVSFTASIGLFNLKPDVTYNFAYFIYTPEGKKLTGSFFDIKTASKNNETSIYLDLNVKIDELTVDTEGVYHFRFQIANLHEEKSTFFYIKQKSIGDADE